MIEAARQSGLDLALAEACDRGLMREENQDSVLHASTPLGELLMVADGIGGYEGGGVASRMVIDAVRDTLALLPPDSPPDLAIREAAARANAAVLTAATAPDSRYRHMGSTVVLALLRQDSTAIQAWIGHIGDSRAYLFRDGLLSRITTDHSAVQALLSRNLITPEQAAHHPDASVLTRSIGQEEMVEIDIDMLSLVPGDMLLLCSDGLWGYVAESQIESSIGPPGDAMENVAARLLQLALDAGGHDNIGIELARVQTKPIAPAGRMHISLFRRRIQFLAVCLLLFAGFGALLFLALEHHWWIFAH
ncbi:MAG TPA: protein phosphatase 2C domain-containing protein [Terracidiphilus sp.]|jgi:serine/threonine protein phosphatase PrpC|nr:protein phosphatase 2C domain-containing protein [Terracidiphilus sp.]